MKTNRNVRKIITFVVILLLLAGATAIAQTCPLDGSGTQDLLGVRIYMQQLHAINTTDGSRDEIYIRVIGRTESGEFDRRLPFANDSDDYYEFRNGQISNAKNPGSWSNKNQHTPYYPEIWNGTLRNGEIAEFIVAVMEQDNASNGSAKTVLEDIFQACQSVAGSIADTKSKLVKGSCKAVGDLVTAFFPGNNQHDMVGAFAVNVRNLNGKLVTNYIAADTEFFIPGTKGGTKLTNKANDPFLISLENKLDANAAHFQGRSSTEGGRYDFDIVSETICASDVTGSSHQLFNDDVERGTCRGGKSVDILLSNGERRPIGVGETIYILGDDNRHIEYWCSGSWEREKNLFKRDYAEFAVERTKSKINYFPYLLVPYISTDNLGVYTPELSLPPEIDQELANLILSDQDGVVSWGATTLADFRITTMNQRCRGVGQPVIRVYLRNVGTGSGRAWVDFFSGLPEPPQIGILSNRYQMSSMLVAGGSQIVEFPLDNSFKGRHFWFDTLADTTQEVAESNENNNHAEAYISVNTCQ